MADERIIRISLTGDASGLNKEIQRTREELVEAFSDIGLDDLLRDADQQFDNVRDKIKALNEELQRLHERQAEVFNNERTPGGNTNEAYERHIEQQQRDYEERQRRAQEALNRFNNSVGGGGGGANPPGGNPNQPNPNPNTPGGALDRDRNPPSLGARVAQRTFGGGGFNPGAGATEAIGGEGGLLRGMGMGSMTAMGVMAFLGLIIKGLMDGQKELKKDMEVSRVLSNSLGVRYGYPGAATGMNQTQFIDYAFNTAKSRGGDRGIATEAANRAYLSQAYGLDVEDVRQFDKFYHSGGGDASSVIVEILKRSEQKGILGVDRNDFSRIPKILEQVNGIMTQQKASGETVDESFAIEMAMRGQTIGGRFADDRLSQAMGRINSNIQTPGNAGMRAYIFEMLKRANPGASYTDVLGMQENGASAGNLRAILPQIAAMGQGEMRRMILHQLTGNWQDAIRLDSSGNLQEMLEATKSTGKATGDQERMDKIKARAEQLTTELDKGVDNAKANWNNFWDAVSTSIDNGLKKLQGQEASSEVHWEKGDPNRGFFDSSGGFNWYLKKFNKPQPGVQP